MSASVQPWASKPTMKSTARRVPRITGFPVSTTGSITIRSFHFISRLLAQAPSEFRLARISSSGIARYGTRGMRVAIREPGSIWYYLANLAAPQDLGGRRDLVARRPSEDNGSHLISAPRLAHRRSFLACHRGTRTGPRPKRFFREALGLSPGRARRLRARRLRPSGGVAARAEHDAAARAARSAFSSSGRSARGVLPDAARLGLGRHFGVRRRLFPRRAFGAPRAHQPPVPRVSRQHGVRPARRRRLSLHGGVGDDGALVLLLGH